MISQFLSSPSFQRPLAYSLAITPFSVTRGRWTHRRISATSPDNKNVRQKLNALEDTPPPQPEVQVKKPGLMMDSVLKPTSASRDMGVFWLCLINTVIFLLDYVFQVQWIKKLYLYNASPQWWQYITSAFCHINWEHLSSNIFLLYVFGKIVEEQEGAAAVWTSYLVCALGASFASVWLHPSSAVSLGASGAVFGLFAVSVLIKISWNFKNLLEVAILGQFVVRQVLTEVVLQAKGGSITVGGNVAHIAHLAGALMGVILIVLLKNIPDPEALQKK